MTKLDPIIAVKDVEVSAEWYRNIFGFNISHGGDHFSVLTNKDNEIVLCLHHRQEFSSRDPDGYFITVSEFHIYEG